MTSQQHGFCHQRGRPLSSCLTRTPSGSKSKCCKCFVGAFIGAALYLTYRGKSATTGRITPGMKGEALGQSLLFAKFVPKRRNYMSDVYCAVKGVGAIRRIL